MFVEIKTGSAINSLSARALADAQTWERFGDYYDATPSISSVLVHSGTT